MTSVYFDYRLDDDGDGYRVTRYDTNTGRATVFQYDFAGVAEITEYRNFDPATFIASGAMRAVEYRSEADGATINWFTPYYDFPGPSVVLDETNDTETYADSIEVLARGGDDTITTNGQHNIVFGGDGQDVLNGGSGPDILSGGNEHDVIHGGPKNDYLFGGAGDDELLADGGNDVLIGGQGTDRLLGYAGDDIFFDLFGATQIYGGSGQDFVVTGHGGSTVSLGEGDDIFQGGAGKDFVHGDSGTDAIYGNAGNDTIYGDGGEDFIDAGNGDDLVHGGTENDVITDLGGNDKLYGDAGDDRISAGDGTDRLYGGDGLDNLFTGAGQAYMWGGANADAFHLDTFSNGHDHRIEDFSRAEDTIHIGVLQGYDGDVDSFVRLVTRDAARTDIKVNVDGTGGGWTILATLLGVDLTGVTATDLVNNGNLFLN